MIKEFQGRIKVSNEIKPLPLKARKTPKLIIGGNYYVSFGTNNAYPCTLVEIITEFSKTEVRVEIPEKPRSKKGFIDINGNRSYNWKSTRVLYQDEIGSTPEEAVKNEVHF